ncbi:MAG: CoA-binding protein [Deltaproteobacteria bacterium]|nr:CoA-binding protein [Deltaproteobacteria bacterium]
MLHIDMLHTFFNPQGIVIIGARSTPGFGFGMPLTLKEQGFGDRTYLVNPKGGELHGMHVYKSVAEVPDPVDLAVVIVPAQAVLEVLAQIAKRGISNVIIQSAGFAEIGPHGKALQDKAKKMIKKYGLRVIGPNCVGVVNTENRFTTSEVMPEALKPGSLAVIAQSGVFGHNLLDRFNERGLFISKAVTLGNRIDVNESEMLEYFRQDSATKVISMYLEGAADGRLLTKTLARVSQDKPVLVLKSGRTSVGAAATASHTGSLSGEDELYKGMFAQTGTIRAKSLNELVDLAQVFSTQPLPKGNRFAIVTGSGSMGALAADAAVASGLVLPPLSEATAEKSREGAPSWMNVNNPLDVGPSQQFPAAFNALMEDPDIDMVLAVIAMPFAVMRYFNQEDLVINRFFGDITEIKKRSFNKPFLICVVSHNNLVNLIRREAEPEIPVFTSPETATRALAALWRYQRFRARTG